MTREEAIFCEKSYLGETNCIDCKYYGTDTCKSRESHKMAIKALEQEPKTGHWIEGEIWEDTDGGWGRWQKCSVCRESEHHKKNFCPNCGVKMVEPQESEEEHENHSIT